MSGRKKIPKKLMGRQTKIANSNKNNNVQCTNCMEWEYFEGYGYGCFVMKTMAPLDAEKCEFFANRDKLS